jgi:hypothetical protein
MDEIDVALYGVVTIKRKCDKRRPLENAKQDLQGTKSGTYG